MVDDAEGWQMIGNWYKSDSPPLGSIVISMYRLQVLHGVEINCDDWSNIFIVLRC